MKKRFLFFLTFSACIIVYASASTYAAPVTNGLIAAYEFNGDANDTSGSGHIGTVNGATLTTDRFDNADSAYDFDGINDYIQTDVNSNTKPLSFSVWFKADSNTGERSIVDSDVSGNYGHSLIIGYFDSGHDLDVQYHNGYIDTEYLVNTTDWYHAVVNYSSTIELWVNGDLKRSIAYSTTSFDGTDFRFGRHNTGDPQWFDGKIDDIYFFNRTLTTDEIQTLYNASQVPIPGAALLFVSSLFGIVGIRRKLKE